MSYVEPSFITAPDGARLAYHRSEGLSSGSMPGVVFLSGFRSTMNGEKALMFEQWCQQRQLDYLRFDYTGHGHSSGQFAEGSIGRWAADAITAIDQLTQGPQLLVGSSMGGWLMLLIALARPDRVAAMVGIACAADFTERLIKNRLTDAQRSLLQTQGFFETPSAYDDEPTRITRALLEDGRNHLLLSSPIALTQPLRLIHGMNDQDVPYEISLRVAELYAGNDTRVTLIKDAEHRLSRPLDLACICSNIEELLRQTQNTS